MNTKDLSINLMASFLSGDAFTVFAKSFLILVNFVCSNCELAWFTFPRLDTDCFTLS